MTPQSQTHTRNSVITTLLHSFYQFKLKMDIAATRAAARCGHQLSFEPFVSLYVVHASSSVLIQLSTEYHKCQVHDMFSFSGEGLGVSARVCRLQCAVQLAPDPLALWEKRVAARARQQLCECVSCPISSQPDHTLPESSLSFTHHFSAWVLPCV